MKKKTWQTEFSLARLSNDVYTRLWREHGAGEHTYASHKLFINHQPATRMRNLPTVPASIWRRRAGKWRKKWAITNERLKFKWARESIDKETLEHSVSSVSTFTLSSTTEQQMNERTTKDCLNSTKVKEMINCCLRMPHNNQANCQFKIPSRSDFFFSHCRLLFLILCLQFKP